MKRIFVFFSVLCFVMFFLGCSTSVVKETTIETSTDGGKSETTKKINGDVLTKLKTTWENELITAFGQAPVIDKYPEETRNKMLARRGAITDAERNLVEKINELQLTATTTMADFSTSDFVQTRVQSVLKDVEIIIDRYDEKNKLYEIQIQMPKTKIVNILEEYNRR